MDGPVLLGLFYKSATIEAAGGASRIQSFPEGWLSLQRATFAGWLKS